MICRIKIGIEKESETYVASSPIRCPRPPPSYYYPGNRKEKIVDDSHDKREFIDRMGQIALENEIKIYAWVLMTK